jgi:hypothetical protein
LLRAPHVLQTLSPAMQSVWDQRLKLFACADGRRLDVMVPSSRLHGVKECCKDTSSSANNLMFQLLGTAAMRRTTAKNISRVPKYIAGAATRVLVWTDWTGLGLGNRHEARSCLLCLAAGLAMTLLEAHVPCFIHPCLPFGLAAQGPGTLAGNVCPLHAHVCQFYLCHRRHNSLTRIRTEYNRGAPSATRNRQARDHLT